MLDYTAKFVLAPMVRIGELPTRLLALKHGADLVWGPEIIDKKLLTCERKVNKALNTVDFISKTGNKKIPGSTDVVFRTCPEIEKDKVVFQMGTANPDLAVQAALIVVNDVGAIDINAGCPKHFSIHSGMGAALLSTPDLLCDILTSLVEKVGKPNKTPISVKIRLMPTKEESLELVNRLVKTGISNLTLHCRTREMRNREAPIRDYIDEIRDICHENGVSFIINGSVSSHKEYIELQEKFGNKVGAMIASAGEINPTCFNKNGQLSWWETAKEYMQLANEFQNYHTNTKYCLNRMIPNTRNQNKIYQLLQKAKSNEEFSHLLFEKMDREGKYVEIPQESDNSSSKENKQPTNSNKRQVEDKNDGKDYDDKKKAKLQL